MIKDNSNLQKNPIKQQNYFSQENNRPWESVTTTKEHILNLIILEESGLKSNKISMIQGLKETIQTTKSVTNQYIA